MRVFGLNEIHKKVVLAFLLILFLLVGCENKEWTCIADGKNMFSLSSSGELGSADKACTCDEIRSFEMKEFGEVDEVAMKKDFDCD